MNNILQILKEKEITNWDQLIQYVKSIPYGRNSNRTNFSLVITENKGTCSSKHALLKLLSNQFTKEKVQLIIGIYKMNEINTEIGSILTENNIEFIPEAHCYLKINGKILDCTSSESDFEKIRTDLLQEIEIEPNQVAEFKVHLHQEFIKNWLLKTNSQITFEEIWNIREKCIAKLSI